MQFLSSEVADLLDGELIGSDVGFSGASIDSRNIEEGQLFVPLVAERDGHDYVAGAMAGGAAAYLSDRGPIEGQDGPCIHVSDTAEALTRLGQIARQRIDGPVIGITGSVGKTSVKDLTLAACRGARSLPGSVWASSQSFNNEIGVPLTLANAPDDAAIVIVEMGSRGIGHIAELCRVATPTIGVITVVALAHSELFGSLEAVAVGKGELVEALPVDGTAVLNGDDQLVAAMASRTSANVVTFGAGTNGPSLDQVSIDVRVVDVVVDELLRPHFKVESAWGNAEISLEVRGAHMAYNAAAALAAAVAAGVPFGEAADGLAAAELSQWRMQVTKADSGLLIINDAYNANPTSMRAALAALADLEAHDRVAVVGVMAELGEEGPAEHEAICREAAAAGIRLVAVAAPEYGAGAEHVADLDAAYELVQGMGSGSALLVKGSRVAGLERLADRLSAP